MISSKKLLMSLHSFCTKSFCIQQLPNAHRILLDKAEREKGARFLVASGLLLLGLWATLFTIRSDSAFVLELMQRIIAFLYI